MERVFGEEFDMNIIRVNCEDQFLGKLAGVDDPEKNVRLSVKNHRVFEAEAKK